MTISDLTHVESVSEVTHIQGGRRVRPSLINLNIITQIAVPIAIAINLGKGSVTAGNEVWQFG
jgi:hypothetical protein